MLHSLFLVVAQTVPPAGGDTSPQNWNGMIWIAAFMVFLWVMMIRPQQQQRKELANRISSLKTGDRVVTGGGIHGVVSNIKEGSTLTLKVDDNCKLTVDKSSIATVLDKKD